MNDDCFYSSCWWREGHGLWAKTGMSAKLPCDYPQSLMPWKIDAKLAPKMNCQPEGLLSHGKTDGWSWIAFWDRSVDQRFGSNSAFIVRGDHDFISVMQISRAYFPQIWKRFNFEVRMA